MTELSAYEEERSAKIARNKAMMESLGIEAKKDTARQKGSWVKKVIDGPLRRSSRATVARARLSDDVPPKAVKKRRSLHDKNTHERQENQVIIPAARSANLMQRNQIASPNPKIAAVDMVETARKQQSLKPYSVILDGVPPHTIVTEPLVTGHSCKELSLQVPSDEYVGHALYPVGKLATMMWLCPGYHPRFSLLQSHQVWANAMVIFINVDLNDRYTNTFEREGSSLFVYWFARV
ncbi:hypothetical protein, variant [Aphanomyces astaci]|uniref:Uncharacterized protein n=1 Tax=Aphanomyces astaci TaxID=112090 RepID=W4H837_APHAT|nr:hypothetical protein, variant [Aphanomyces astaci]ETV87293.1 hypothetical protein, variant [Aphanomyces astaci]|eukprot:XP_009822156.1 hypothetical protein, variant [Aphanomyces astaci]